MPPRKRKLVPPRPVLKRRGSRRRAGADTPSGPRTSRTAIPAKREQLRQQLRRRRRFTLPRANRDSSA